MHIKTKRLLIRSIKAADAQALAEIWSDPVVTRYMGGPRDIETLLKNFKEEVQEGQPDPFDLWPVVEISSDEVIGHCGLLEKEVDGQPEIELIYVFSSSAWGKGYGTEAALALREYAFGTLGLKRIIALIDPDNQSSGRVAQKVWMKFEKETVRSDDTVRWVYSEERGERSEERGADDEGRERNMGEERGGRREERGARGKYGRGARSEERRAKSEERGAKSEERGADDEGRERNMGEERGGFTGRVVSLWP